MVLALLLSEGATAHRLRQRGYSKWNDYIEDQENVQKASEVQSNTDLEQTIQSFKQDTESMSQMVS